MPVKSPTYVVLFDGISNACSISYHFKDIHKRNEICLTLTMTFRIGHILRHAHAGDNNGQECNI